MENIKMIKLTKEQTKAEVEAVAQCLTTNTNTRDVLASLVYPTSTDPEFNRLKNQTQQLLLAYMNGVVKLGEYCKKRLEE